MQTLGDIFVVDDNINNLQLLEAILKEKNYKVRMATSGKSALRAIALASPEIILLDVNMPEMDGYSVCQYLKAEGKYKHIPVLFLSASDTILDKVKAFQVGAVDYITKPFHQAEILARVETQLQLARLTQELLHRNKELQEKNKELQEKNEELLDLYVTGKQIFTNLADILPGTLLDKKYRLEKKIGQGGFSAVFQATHLDLNREVAIKILQPQLTQSNQKTLELLRREGISTCQVQHPHAISVFDFGVSLAGYAYMVMELLQGHSLKEELEKYRFLELNRSLEIFQPICEALAEAHAAGVIHRDIKPENIFLHYKKSGEIVKVLDFGIAHLKHKEPFYGQSETLIDSQIFGTPLYMAPERFTSLDCDEKSDIYSLGVLLYRMLSGTFPFLLKKTTVKVWLTHLLQQEPRSIREVNPWLPLEIEPFLKRMLAKHPKERPSALELLQEIEELKNIFHYSAYELNKETKAVNPQEFLKIQKEISDFKARNSATPEQRNALSPELEEEQKTQIADLHHLNSLNTLFKVQTNFPLPEEIEKPPDSSKPKEKKEGE
jgi:serine/threonine protein kinase/CheY-like chemotaxis protein